MNNNSKYIVINTNTNEAELVTNLQYWCMKHGTYFDKFKRNRKVNIDGTTYELVVRSSKEGI